MSTPRDFWLKMDDERIHANFMRDALAAGEPGRGRTHPNPCVGAVVVRDGHVVGRGLHRGPGNPHAEIEAMRDAGDSSGADLYVTLEPCCTFGRTPPCTDAILASGVRRVFTAIEDPNPAVKGRGLAKLRARGVEVHCGILEREAQSLDPAYHHFYRKGRPLVHLKWAQTLDGRYVAARGRYITGAEARRVVHEERAQADAILVSAGTVLQDDPSLTARLPGRDKRLVRIILDRMGTLVSERRVFKRAVEDGPCWIIRPSGIAAQPFPSMPMVECLELPPDGQGGIDLGALMGLLRTRQILSLYVEAVGPLAGTFLDSGFVDRLSIHVALRLGGRGRGCVESTGADEAGLSLEGATTERAGKDIIIRKDLEGRCLQG